MIQYKKIILPLILLTIISISSLAYAAEADVKPMPWKTEETSASSMVVTMVQGLALCIGVLFIGLAIYKRINPNVGNRGQKTTEILERLQVSQRTQLVLARFNKKKILFSVGPERVTLLDTGGEGFRIEEKDLSDFEDI